MLTATEVANKSHVKLALKAGIDILWIGARTSANPFAVQEIADALNEEDSNCVVLVKNPINPDLELWIGALKRIYNAGIHKLGAIHRGFSVYGKHLYRNIPEWRIPIELQRQYPDLPLFCDPSHISGRRDLIASVSQQALDLKYYGLIIESHCNPEEALSDKDQQLTPDSLKQILDNLVIRDKISATENLESLRRQIDTINEELLELLARRMSISREIGLYKKNHDMPVIQAARYDALISQMIRLGKEAGMSERFIHEVMAAIHEESVRQQLEIVNGPTGNNQHH